MRIRAREAAEHQGAMVAVFLGSTAAAQVAVPDGEPADDLHVTLAFLGPDVDQLDTTVDQVAEVLAAVAADRPTLTGTITGTGRFVGTDGTDAVWSAVDVVGLDELRVAVVDALEAAGITVDTTHGFTPHITVAYVPTGDDAPATTTDPVEISFDELTLAWADARTTYTFGGAAMATKKRSAEAFPGDRTYNDVRSLLESHLTERFGGERTWIWVRDLTDTDCIYTIDSDEQLTTWQVGFTVAEDGSITLAEPVEVEARTTYEPIATPATATVTEARQHLVGRVVESKGTDSATGGRIFGVEILQYGTSKNGVRYTEGVMAAAVPLYEGAKVFDHHRTAAELASSTVAGLAGGLRNVEATGSALTADLHLLPSATHIAEALDASLEAQAAGLPPLVGMSHDVALSQREAVEGTRKIKEATEIHSVFSVDVVADPSAGGRVTRTVAGGICDTQLPEEITMTTLAELLEGASDEDKAAFRSLLGDATSTTTAPAPDPAAATATTEGTTYTTGQPLGRLLVETAVKGAGLDDRLTEAVTTQLGDRFTEADLARVIETAKTFGEKFEIAGLAPRTPAQVAVTKEALDKKIERLDRTLEGDFTTGYPSVKQAYADITGLSGMDLIDGDLPMRILRESAQHTRYEGMRQVESVTTATWGQIFADALHRRLTSVYQGNDLQGWRDLVSTISPRMDFRTNHVVRMGGYGVLPTVAEGDPYTALTSPPDEEATYTLAKKGGTEDLTLEAIANDDMGAVRRIPQALARGAALTLYRFVVDTLFKDNPTIYDSVALFASGHANTTAVALNRDNLQTVRAKMRKQAAYGVAADVLGITPKFLWVPADLERTAWELCTSAVAVTGDGNATIPNINQNMVPKVVDHWSDPTDWFVTADPTTIETIELGFYNGKQDPELFVQDDPKTGAVFTNDKITWKIRHVYAGAVVDYRGFQRGTVSDA